MNNSKIVRDNLEDVPDRVESLKKQQGELAQVIEAIHAVESSEDWQKLKRLVLDGVISTLERQLQREAKKDQVDTTSLYRLQGQLVWARKYADLSKLAEFFRTQMDNLKNQINEQENPRDGAL